MVSLSLLLLVVILCGAVHNNSVLGEHQKSSATSATSSGGSSTTLRCDGCDTSCCGNTDHSNDGWGVCFGENYSKREKISYEASSGNGHPRWPLDGHYVCDQSPDQDQMYEAGTQCTAECNSPDVYLPCPPCDPDHLGPNIIECDGNTGEWLWVSTCGDEGTGCPNYGPTSLAEALLLSVFLIISLGLAVVPVAFFILQLRKPMSGHGDPYPLFKRSWSHWVAQPAFVLLVFLLTIIGSFASSPKYTTYLLVCAATCVVALAVMFFDWRGRFPVWWRLLIRTAGGFVFFLCVSIGSFYCNYTVSKDEEYYVQSFAFWYTTAAVIIAWQVVELSECVLLVLHHRSPEYSQAPTAPPAL